MPYCLIAPKVTPRKRCFRMAKITINTGMRNAKVPAAMADHSMPPRPSMVAMAGGAVRAFSLVNIKAKAYSFQTKIRLKTVVAAMPVAACGTTIL
jgi:hypothetical protein